MFHLPAVTIHCFITAPTGWAGGDHGPSAVGWARSPAAAGWAVQRSGTPSHVSSWIEFISIDCSSSSPLNSIFNLACVNRKVLTQVVGSPECCVWPHNSSVSLVQLHLYSFKEIMKIVKWINFKGTTQFMLPYCSSKLHN